MQRPGVIHGLIIQNHAAGPIVQYLDHTVRLRRSPDGWGVYVQKAGEAEKCWADRAGGYETVRMTDARAQGFVAIYTSAEECLRIDLEKRTIQFRTPSLELLWTCGE